jgi:polysaccharide export outer membrane protein
MLRTPITRAAVRRLAAAVVAVLVAGSAAGAPADDYRLAPGDKVTVTVFGQPQISGDMTVDGGGRVVVPLIDPVSVAKLTLLEAQAAIRERLADGILQQPSVSVRIAELRPIYVTGDVRVSGAFPFRFGTTVQAAIALAGGFGPAETLQGTALSDFLAAEERVRLLTRQKQALTVRAVRLEAEFAGGAEFVPPEPPPGVDAPGFASAVANEKDAFAAQTALLRRQLDVLRSQKPRLQQQIDALNEQVTAGKKQLDLVNQQVDRYDKLVKQGLGTSMSDFQFRLTQSTQEGVLWRLKADASRLEMEAGNLDVRIEEAEALYKRQVATELREVRERLGEVDASLPLAREIREVRLQYAGGVVRAGAKRTITVTRLRDGVAVSREANETTTLEPGDAVEVQRLLPAQGLVGDVAGGERALAAAGPGLSP